MKRKLFILSVIVSTILFGCGKTKTVEFSNSSEKLNDENIENIVEEYESTVDYEVSVILTMYSFDESETIDEYVIKMNKENNSNSFSVYDENHYLFNITESERKEVLVQYNSGEFIEESFNEIFTDEQYNSSFIKMDYDELFQNVTFYADKGNYESAGLSVVIGPVLISNIYSDIIQGYNLIPLEERKCTVKVVDNETNEVIYDSSIDNN